MNNLEKYYQEVDALEEKRLQECDKAEQECDRDMGYVWRGYTLAAGLSIILLVPNFHNIQSIKLFVKGIGIFVFGGLGLMLIRNFASLIFDNKLTKKYAELKNRLQRKYIINNKEKR